MGDIAFCTNQTTKTLQSKIKLKPKNKCTLKTHNRTTQTTVKHNNKETIDTCKPVQLPPFNVITQATGYSAKENDQN